MMQKLNWKKKMRKVLKMKMMTKKMIKTTRKKSAKRSKIKNLSKMCGLKSIREATSGISEVSPSKCQIRANYN
jgi:hypothetical protein